VQSPPSTAADTAFTEFAAWYARRLGRAVAPASVTAQDLLLYRGWLRRHARPAVANRHLDDLRALFAWAAGARLIATDPSSGVARIPEM
jgi:site-specific recombinase XerD